MENRFAFILQARIGSVRLPNKMLMPFFNGKTIPEIIIAKIKASFPSHNIIVATTTEEKDDVLVKNLEKYPVSIFRGAEDNVLARFIDCGKEHGIASFIRICADNPFLDMVLLKELIAGWSDDLDYLTHQINGKPSMKTGFGFFSEISTMASLKKAENLTTEALYREHVTNFIYENPAIFKVKMIDAGEMIAGNEGVRLTVDTQEDFNTASQVYDQLSNTKPHFNYQDVLGFIRKENLIEKMKIQGDSNKK